MLDIFDTYSPEWMEHPDRNCAAGVHATATEVRTHADKWFPVGQYATTQYARRLCHGCPVQTDCLKWALDHKEEGIWAGTTDADRERLRKDGAA